MTALEQTSEGPQVPKTKLEIVRVEVQQNPDIYLAGEISQFHTGGWTQGVNMIVAPIKPEFDADALNELMFGLIKGIEPTQNDRFYGYPGTLKLGKLYFDEQIGLIEREITTTVTAYDMEAMLASGIELNPKNPSIQKEPLKRRTWLRVYPDVTSAATIYQYESGTREGTTEPTLDISRFGYEIPRPYLEKIKAQYKNPAARFD